MPTLKCNHIIIQNIIQKYSAIFLMNASNNLQINKELKILLRLNLALSLINP